MADPYLYIRSTEDKRLIIGGEDEPYSWAGTYAHLFPGRMNRLTKSF